MSQLGDDGPQKTHEQKIWSDCTATQVMQQKQAEGVQQGSMECNSQLQAECESREMSQGTSNCTRACSWQLQNADAAHALQVAVLDKAVTKRLLTEPVGLPTAWLADVPLPLQLAHASQASFIHNKAGQLGLQRCLSVTAFTMVCRGVLLSFNQPKVPCEPIIFCLTLKANL